MKKMKKLLAVLTAGVMCAAMTAGAYVTAQEFPAVSDAAESTVMVQDDGETKVEGDFSYRVQEDGTIEILEYVGKNTATSVNIPSEIENKIVTRIGEHAFPYGSSAETISLPSTLTSIGRDAFKYTALYQNQSGPRYVGKWLVSDYGNSKIDVADGTIGLADCSMYNVSEVTLPDTLKYIGVATFSTSSLTQIKIPKSVVSIGKYAFDSATKLVSIEIPEGITSIEEYSFYKCSSLVEVKLPDSITHIGQFAFYNTALLLNDRFTI